MRNIRTGDVWRMNDHEIMCGDARSESDVNILMNDEMADLIFTDPPYGIPRPKGTGPDGGIKGMINNFTGAELLEFHRTWIPIAFQFLKDNGSCYIWGADEPLMDIYSDIIRPWQDEGYVSFRNLITWDKGSGMGMRTAVGRKYAMIDEKCMFVWKGKATKSADRNAHYFDNARESMGSVWRFNRAGEKERAMAGGHTTLKPIELCKRGILTSSREDELVIDLFGGSGSTLIACELTNRRCRMMEIEPTYVEVAISRWESIAKGEAILVAEK